MPREFSRTLRLGEQIHRELAMLLRKVKDPRVGAVTIGEVEVSKDLQHAKVYFTVLDPEAVPETSRGLARASGFLRRELGRGLRTRVVPELHFIYDETEERSARISALIDAALRRDRALGHGDEADGDAHDAGPDPDPDDRA
jgi:ribosome-binding factor A